AERLCHRGGCPCVPGEAGVVVAQNVDDAPALAGGEGPDGARQPALLLEDGPRLPGVADGYLQDVAGKDQDARPRRALDGAGQILDGAVRAVACQMVVDCNEYPPS